MEILAWRVKTIIKQWLEAQKLDFNTACEYWAWTSDARRASGLLRMSNKQYAHHIAATHPRDIAGTPWE